MGDLAPWDAAVAAADKARGLLVAGVDPRRAEAGRGPGRRDRRRARPGGRRRGGGRRDRRLVDRLADIRSARADDRQGDATDIAYGEAFREAEIDVDALSSEEAGRRIKARPTEIASALAMTLDDWAAIRRSQLKDNSGALRLAAAARLADPDPWRNRLRDAVEIADTPARRARLSGMATSIEDRDTPPISFDLLGKALFEVGAWTEAESVLRQGVRVHARDVWLNYDLARVLEKLALPG